MEMRLPTFLQRIKTAWAILTGRASLWLGINALEARWVCEPAGDALLHIRLDIRLNKVTYTADRTFVCPNRTPADRSNAIDQVMKEMVHEVVYHVLNGGKR